MNRNRSIVCAILLTTPAVAQQFRLELIRDVLDQQPVASLTHPAAADLDGDGLPELLFAGDPRFPAGSWLFRNAGARFAPMPAAQQPPAIKGTATFDDIDGDGDLDVIETGQMLRVLENDGSGRLLETTHRRAPTNLWTFGECVHADIEGDGDHDILLCRGGVLVNDGSGVFVDETAARVTTTGFAIGLRMAARDFDGDGDIDFIVMSGLHRNDGNGNFTLDPNANISHQYGESPFAIDADLDGDDDILLSSGRLFDNDGNGNFTEMENVLLPAQPGHGMPFELSGIADIDGDGATDLLVTPLYPHYGDRPSWVPNDGHGTFRFDQLHQLPCEHLRLGEVLAHDLDGDGDLDLVVTRSYSQTPAPIEVLYNDGDGAFHNAVEVGGLDTPRHYDRVVIDFDGDGDRDVLAGGTLHRNDGRGAFTRESFAELLYARHYVDLDGDGLLDAIGTDRTWLQQRGTTWTAGQVLLPSGVSVQRAATIDFDGDQDADIVMTAGSYPGPYTVRVFENDGSGNLTAIDPAAMGLGGLEPAALVAGDFDGDGKADLAFGFHGFFLWGGSPVRLFVNAGNDQFAEAPMPATPWSASGLHAVDTDGDLDLVTESSNLPQLYVNDGGLQFSAVEVNAVGTNLAVADANDDGYLDIWANVNGWPTPHLNDGNHVFTAAPQLLDPTRAHHPTHDFFALDLENDGDVDIVAVPDDAHTSTQYLVPMWNHLRQLRAPHLTRTGGSFALQLSSHVEETGPQLALIGISTATAAVDLGALGTLGIDLTSAVTFVESLPGNGTHERAIPMPNATNLIGTALHAQALLLTPAGMHLTGTADTVVL